jgi:hypothetical protein
MTQEKKNLFEKAIDALTNRDEKEAEAQAQAEAEAARKKGAEIKARVQAERAAAAAPKKGVVAVRSLHIRKDHSTTSAEVGGLTKGNEVTILETWSDGKNTWAKLGPDRWAAIVYNGETLIKLS